MDVDLILWRAAAWPIPGNVAASILERRGLIPFEDTEDGGDPRIAFDCPLTPIYRNRFIAKAGPVDRIFQDPES